MGKFSNLIIVLNGPSAGGKTLVMEELIARPEVNVDKLVTVTTRQPRTSPKVEVNGVDYYFITPEEFETKKSAPAGEDVIVEETEYPKGSGVKYGIFDSEIKRIRKLGKDAIAVLDIHGVSEMKRFYGAENVISIFVYRDLGIILDALKERNLPEEEIEKRMTYAKQELLNISKADFVLYNIGTKEELIANAIGIIEKVRISRG